MELPTHKRYPIEPNGVELALGGIASALALAAPRRGLDLYESPAKYLAVSASVLLGYYAILAFADIYCFEAPDGSAQQQQQKQRRRRRRLGVGARVRKVGGMCLGTAAAAGVIAAGLVLFGAPLASQHGATLAAAANVALLAVTPAILTLDADPDAWRRALLAGGAKTVPEQWAAGFFWCTMGAAWASAFFIPLDWDRPWQRWPIPIVGGAYLGNLLSLLYVLVRCFVLPVARADYAESEAGRRRHYPGLKRE
ncbi:Glycosylphosphatidylinositol (GPI) anchor assembly protein [Coemansia javaensis]|uniref:Glycosylphosphatidylinositol (GPI) anchor assembly protein n=1 Tax=Coemansia javaensis TaxID=2761396 RepID=A0A9W8LJP3_9FUNG|nr:Glycosylphosphatidylinositol (GPI) anchor assembly protein [Coemansia javaensis]